MRIENEHDRFYGSVARYYSGIFPLNPVQIMCIVNELGSLEGKNLLDIGCGCGNLAFGLAGKGATVTAIDLNVAGFLDIRVYADFRKTPAGGKHLPLVFLCRKTS